MVRHTVRLLSNHMVNTLLNTPKVLLHECLSVACVGLSTFLCLLKPGKGCAGLQHPLLPWLWPPGLPGAGTSLPSAGRRLSVALVSGVRVGTRGRGRERWRWHCSVQSGRKAEREVAGYMTLSSWDTLVFLFARLRQINFIFLLAGGIQSLVLVIDSTLQRKES